MVINEKATSSCMYAIRITDVILLVHNVAFIKFDCHVGVSSTVHLYKKCSRGHVYLYEHLYLHGIAY